MAASSPSNSAARTSSAPPLPVGPWNAALRYEGVLNGAGQVLIGRSNALYGLTTSSVVRFDPSSADVAATASIRGSDPVFIYAGGAIWTAGIDAPAHRVRVQELDPTSLAAGADVSFPVGGSPDRVAIAASPDSDTLFIGAGDVVATVDVKTHAILRKFTVSGGHVGALASTASGYLYLGLDSDSGTVALQRRDPASGDVLANIRFGNWINEVVPTAGGLWLSSHGGMEASLGFYPDGDLSKPPAASFTAASSPPPTVTVIDGVAWIGTTSELACADPDTGAVKAKVQLQSGTIFSDVATAGDQWYAASYGADLGQGVATITPPTACMG